MKGDVFRPHLPPPTMTLEEFADQEVRDALAREKAAKENPPSVTRRYCVRMCVYASMWRGRRMYGPR